MQAQFAALAKTMESARSGPMVADNVAAYKSQLDHINQLRPAFNDLIQASGAYTVETVKSVTASQALTKSIMDGKVSVTGAIKNWTQFKTTIRQVANEQAALGKAMAMQWTNSSTGKSMTDVYFPTTAVASAQQRMGVWLNALKAGSTSIQDWGKNTQWAGRQITAGFTMPLALASAGLIKLATDTDTELTKLVKMYNTQDLEKKYSDPAQLAIAKEQELSQVRTQAFSNAMAMAKAYGSQINDTLEIEAQFASKGFKGGALQDLTDQTMKVSQIGAISSSDAMNLVMSATSAFKIAPENMSDAMNFLNALKNNTNLTMQDIATSIPKIGATVATLVPPTKDANAALKETGILLAAFAEGGVPAAQGANSLRTALSRALSPVTAAKKEFASLNTEVKEFQGASGKGIDLQKIIDKSGGDPMALMTTLGQALKGQTNENQVIALSKLFGIQRSNNMLIAIKNLVDANPNTQTGAAMQLGKEGPQLWQDIADQEIKQFQQSASGRLHIAVQTMKGELTQLGGPLLNMLTPVVHGLTAIVGGIVKLGQVLPGPIKTILTIGTIGVALLGPLGMIVGIATNAVGFIGKIAAAIGLWGNGTKMQSKEQAAQNALMRDSIKATETASEATTDLAAKMQQVVDIMAERMKMQEEMNAAVKEGAEAELQAADAAEKNAAAKGDSAAADDVATSAATTNVEEVLAQISAINELTAAERAAMEARAISYRDLHAALPENNNMWGFKNPPNTNIPMWNPTSEDVINRRVAASWKAVKSGIGTSGAPVDGEGRVFAAGANGAIEEMSPGKAQAIADQGRSAVRKAGERLAAAEKQWVANATDIIGRGSVTGAPNFSDLSRSPWGGSTTAMGPYGEFGRGYKYGAGSSYVGSASDYWTNVSAHMGRSASINVPNPMALATSSTSAAAGEAERAAKEAEKASEGVAENSAKAGVSWGKIAGNVGALAMGGIMVKDMADGSGNIATNILQAGLAFSMLAPVGAQILGVFKKIVAQAAGLAAESSLAASLSALSWTKAWTVIQAGGTKAWSAIKWLFNPSGGLWLTALVAAGAAIYTINEQMTKAQRQQDKINQSTKDWATILGYTSKSAQTFTDTNGIASYSARQKAVEQLASANQSLVDKLNAAKGAQNKYNIALDEALKVKVDGGSTTQAKEAFQVALQAAGMDAAEIKKLSLKFDSVNLDDPTALQNALNDQVASALKGLNGDNMGPGFWEGFGGAIKGIFDNSTDNTLSDDVLAKLSSAANNLWDTIDSEMTAGDKNGLKNTGKKFGDDLNNMFKSTFDDIRASDGNAQIFKHLGIKTISDLQQALADAMNTPKNKLNGWQKKLLGNSDDIFSNSGYGAFTDAFDHMLDDIGKASGMTQAQIDDMKSKIKSAGGVAKYFGDQMTTAAQQSGDAMQQAAGKVVSLKDAMDLTNANISPDQMTKMMQDSFGGTMSTYVQQMSEAFQQQQQAAADAIQKSGDAEVKALQDSQKKEDAIYDAKDKAITEHYKKLGKDYDANIKKKQNEAKAETDAISKQIDALKKSDTTRQDLFNAEQTRLQRLAQMQTNNIDFNAALNSGNLDEAARIYANNAAQTQQNMLQDQQTAADKASQAQQDALQKKIDNINTERDAYVQSQQDMKDALSDREQAEHDALSKQKQQYDDAMQAQITASQQATQASIKASNDRYQKDKEYIDLQIAAYTAFVPRSVAETKTQMGQVAAAYGDYGKTMKLYGQDWTGVIAQDFATNMTKASNAVQSDIGWKQMGDYITQQLSDGAGFTLQDALSFLKTGKWPEDKKKAPVTGWHQTKAQAAAIKAIGAPTSGHEQGYKTYANHIGGLAGAHELSLRSRGGISPNAPIQPSEYLTLMQHGEYVVNKGAADKNRALLDAINSGNVPAGGFLVRHGGGSIGNAASNLLVGSAALTSGVMLQAAKTAVSEAFGMSQAGSGGAPYTGIMSGSIQGALQFARAQQGKPYIWGGAGPAGQDCSGFMSVVYNYLMGASPSGSAFPWGRDWVTASFANGREFGPWKRGNGANHAFRIGVDPGSHMAGTLGGINIESGSGHGPMVGGKALGSSSGFAYQYYLPAADIPQLYKGGVIQYDNTLANLHKGETVLTAPLTEAFMKNVANGGGSSYNVENVNIYGPFSSQIDFEKGVENALYKLDAKNGRNRTIS